MDRDQILAHCNLFHHRPQHLLFFDGIHFLRRLVQAAKKGLQRVAQLDPTPVLYRSQIQVLLLGLQCPDFLFDLGRSLSQLGQRHQPFLIGIQQFIHLLAQACQLPLHPVLALLHWTGVQTLGPSPFQLGLDQLWRTQQPQHFLPNQIIHIILSYGTARTGRPPQVPVSVGTQTSVIFDLAPRGSSRGPIQGVAALFAHQEAL